MKEQIIIIGAGITGLTAGMKLKQEGYPFKIIEAAGEVGGRVRSKTIDNYTLDLGFQVLLTAYPLAQKMLDYEKLGLSYFDPGALILHEDGTRSIMGDPIRNPSYLFHTLFAKIGTLQDKWKIYRLANVLKKKEILEIFSGDEQSSLDYLKNFGFSEKVIEIFFRPFFSGIFLESALQTSHKMLEFVFKMFSEGYAAIPDQGIHAIPLQLASKLGEGNILLNHRVSSINNGEIQIENGSAFNADRILICTEPNELTAKHFKINRSFVGTTNIHFLAQELPYDKALIALNSSTNKLISNMSIPGNLKKPNNAENHLISLSSVGILTGKDIEKDVKKELTTWFSEANNWTMLDRTDIHMALPEQKTVHYSGKTLENNGVYYASDFLSSGSINSAMQTGLDAAEQLIKSLK